MWNKDMKPPEFYHRVVSCLSGPVVEIPHPPPNKGRYADAAVFFFVNFGPLWPMLQRKKRLRLHTDPCFSGKIKLTAHEPPGEGLGVGSSALVTNMKPPEDYIRVASCLLF
jgi:hypothetical protein